MGKSKINIYKLPGSTKQEERIHDALKLLGLEGMCFSFAELTERAVKLSNTFYDFLESLIEYELVWIVPL